jgi:hypothetical protein
MVIFLNIAVLGFPHENKTKKAERTQVVFCSQSPQAGHCKECADSLSKFRVRASHQGVCRQPLQVQGTCKSPGSVQTASPSSGYVQVTRDPAGLDKAVIFAFLPRLQQMLSLLVIRVHF